MKEFFIVPYTLGTEVHAVTFKDESTVPVTVRTSCGLVDTVSSELSSDSIPRNELCDECITEIEDNES